ncbi:MAG: hypothetical protein U1F76_21140 [Candidatus Competibacteraceae bacterium]
MASDDRLMVTVISGVTQWRESQWPTCLEVMKARRRRKRQTLPAAVQSLLLLVGKAANVLSLEVLAA